MKKIIILIGIMLFVLFINAQNITKIEKSGSTYTVYYDGITRALDSAAIGQTCANLFNLVKSYGYQTNEFTVCYTKEVLFPKCKDKYPYMNNYIGIRAGNNPIYYDYCSDSNRVIFNNFKSRIKNLL